MIIKVHLNIICIKKDQRINLKGSSNMSQALSNAQSDMFISSIMKIPPHKVNNAVAVFTLPKSQSEVFLYVLIIISGNCILFSHYI
ncbi:unnamed protein product [Paramecium pentaurelia]|uniref:Uncharacterized protein n=1 Tax=Paramecium pentaurelia TaxID=43138 RepID=A0A8S1YND4_9CILI|nr:unnamed protein product [Paramecium pentaurelia]